MRSLSLTRFVVLVILLSIHVLQAKATTDSVYKYLGSHIDDVESVAASPNNTYFASGSWDRTISVFANDSNHTLVQSLWGHNAAVSALAFSRDGKKIVSGGKDYKVIVWHYNDTIMEFEMVKEISMIHTAGINSVVYGPGMRNVYSAGDDGRIMIYDLIKNKSKIIENKTAVTSIALSTNRRFIYCADESTVVKQYDGLGNLVKEFKGHTDYVNTVAYSLNNKYLITGSNDKTAIIWNVATGRPVKTLKGHEWKITSLAISADSKYVVTGSSDGTVKTWDIESGEMLNSYHSSGESVKSVAFSADLQLVICGMHLTSQDDREYGPILLKTGLKRTVVAPRQGPPRVERRPGTRSSSSSSNKITVSKRKSDKSKAEVDTNKKVIKKTDEVEVFIEEEVD